MKALSQGLVKGAKGQIDQVGESVNLTWVQPRQRTSQINHGENCRSQHFYQNCREILIG